MKSFRLPVFAILFIGTCSAIVRAQDAGEAFVDPPSVKPSPSYTTTIISPGEVAATPEMWFYEQERLRYADPRQAVRAQAEYRAMQRSRRLAAMKWFGFSNSRPTASPDPIHGTYSPRFVGNGYIPSHWIGGGSSLIIAQQPARRY